MTYKEAVEYLTLKNRAFCKVGLDRVRELCFLLGSPEKSLKIIHIAGTNGKGSTSKMLSGVLSNAGYRTGLFTSPYIRHFNERIMIDGEMISESELAEYTQRVKRVADKMADTPTEFELLVALAFLYFKEKSCDYAVVECGLGGRGDATNIIETSILSIITSISIDHTNFLGDTIEKIASEKAGIIKSAPVLFGGENKEALAVIKSEANSHGVPLFTVDYTKSRIISSDIRGTAFHHEELGEVRLSLLGLYQIKNATLVIEAVKILNSLGVNIENNALLEALASCRFEGRFELLSDDPTFIFDGAHNADGIAFATATIEHYFGTKRAVVISGVLADKEYEIIAKNIARVASFVYTITPDNPRALDASEYARVISGFSAEAEPTFTISEAVDKAISRAKQTGAPVVTLGSLYTYAEVSLAIEARRTENKRV